MQRKAESVLTWRRQGSRTTYFLQAFICLEQKAIQEALMLLGIEDLLGIDLFT
jgi:hypothetical protein